MHSKIKSRMRRGNERVGEAYSVLVEAALALLAAGLAHQQLAYLVVGEDEDRVRQRPKHVARLRAGAAERRVLDIQARRGEPGKSQLERGGGMRTAKGT